jgi:hypothetical protein
MTIPKVTKHRAELKRYKFWTLKRLPFQAVMALGLKTVSASEPQKTA